MTILLCDARGILRDGLRAILTQHGFDVVGEAADQREAISLATRLRPALALMEVSLPGLNGIVVTDRLQVEVPITRVIALSTHADRRYVLAMFSAGAWGYVVKNSVSEELLEALHSVAADRPYLSPTIKGITMEECRAATRFVRRASHSRSVTMPRLLSIREREVLQLIAEGLSSKDVSARLQIAVTTVETHRRQIMDKLSLRSVAELTKYAVREGLTSLE